MADQIPVRVPDYLRRAGSDQKVKVLKENGNVVFTKEYVKHTLQAGDEWDRCAHSYRTLR